MVCTAKTPPNPPGLKHWRVKAWFTAENAHLRLPNSLQRALLGWGVQPISSDLGTLLLHFPRTP